MTWIVAALSLLATAGDSQTKAQKAESDTKQGVKKGNKDVQKAGKAVDKGIRDALGVFSKPSDKKASDKK